MKIKKELIEFTILIIIAVVLIAFSANAKNGALHGAELAFNIIIPSLLPLLIILNLLSNSNAGRLIQNFFAPITEKVLRLPRCTGNAIFFGLIGGYPTGALLTEGLYQNEYIDSETAKRLLRFNINGGVAFIITGVGASILENQKSGIILYISTTISSLLIAFLSSFKYKKVNSYFEDFSAMRFSDALNKSTDASIRAVLNISAYIILFSALMNVINVPDILQPIFEITSGITDNYRVFSLPAIAFLLAFSGFCIHFQIFSIIKKVDMRYLDFLIWRIVHSILSYIICQLLLMIFPYEKTVFSNSAQNIAVPFSVNITLSMLMIMGCGVIILDISSRGRKV